MTRPRSSPPLGVFDGVRALFGGLAFVVRTPKVWPAALVPMVVAAVLFIGLAIGVAFGVPALLDAIGWGEPQKPWATIGHLLVQIVLFAAGLLLSFFLAMALAQPLSGSALETIVTNQEAALGVVRPPATGVSAVASVGRSLRVTGTALAVGIPILAALTVVTLMFPPVAVVTVPLKFVVTGVLAAYDLLDYPFGLRGHDVRERVAFIRRNFGAVVGFGVSFAALLLVPGMALLLLPFGVAGATRLLVAHERASARGGHEP